MYGDFLLKTNLEQWSVTLTWSDVRYPIEPSLFLDPRLTSSP